MSRTNDSVERVAQTQLDETPSNNSRGENLDERFERTNGSNSSPHSRSGEFPSGQPSPNIPQIIQTTVESVSNAFSLSQASATPSQQQYDGEFCAYKLNTFSLGNCPEKFESRDNWLENVEIKLRTSRSGVRWIEHNTLLECVPEGTD